HGRRVARAGHRCRHERAGRHRCAAARPERAADHDPVDRRDGHRRQEVAVGWPRAEIEEAFTAYVAAGAEAGRSGDWSKWPDIFTEDCEYVEHMYGVFKGRDAVREWITKTMGEYPGNLMHEFPINWYLI